ncbi:MAG: hypothetical protein ACK40G_15760 [Cytophagaceae bacterium]
MITIAEQYYIKALNLYPYSLDEFMEQIHYALSYDPEHAGANLLMGKMYMEQFQKYSEAEPYFQKALAGEPDNMFACERLAVLYIYLRAFDKAERVIRYWYTVQGACLAQVRYTEAMLCEYQRDYVRAKYLFEMAMMDTYNNDYMSFLEAEIDRVEKKIAKGSKYKYLNC